MTASEPTTTELTPEQQKRLFDHGLHEDKLFNDRLSFFLVFESLLLNVVASLYRCGTPAPALVFASFAALGLVTTLIWVYVQRRQYVYVRVLIKRLEDHFPEFADTRLAARGKHGLGFRAMPLLTYAIPGSVLVLWLGIFVVASSLILETRSSGIPLVRQAAPLATPH
jgi:hypothetical protein